MSMPPEGAPNPTTQSIVAPSGGAGQGAAAEGEAGTAAAEANAKAQEEAKDRRQRETINARQIASDREAAGNKELAERAEEVKGMIKDRLPPAGPGLPEVDIVVVAATMDPNNPVLNPDMSRMGNRRDLPPGARVPKPILPGESTETQYATKPLSDEHAEEAKEVAKGLPEPIYPPAGSQPTVELTEEEQAEQDRRQGESGTGQRQIEQNPQPQPTQYPAQQPPPQPAPGFIDPAQLPPR